MTTDKTTDPALPRTLTEAHEAVTAIRPRQGALLTEWLAYHQRCAAMYAEIAEIDRGHHHEALAMAERARELAKEIKTRIPAQQPVSEV